MRPASSYRSLARTSIGLGLAALALSSGCGRSDRPNLVLITVDALRRDLLEDYGARVLIPFPVMSDTDRLMDRSVVLLDCYTPSPRTTQSAASLMTGVHPTHHGAFGLFHTLPETATTLAERLRDEGYRTAAVVTSFFLSAGRGFEQGFDTYDDSVFRQGSEFAELVVDRADLHLTETLDEPFFLWVHLGDPAWPYDPPRPILSAMHPEYVREFTLYADIDSGLVNRGEVIFENAFDAEDRRHMQRRYLGEAAYADGHIGRLAGILEARGFMKNTLLVFASLQGESMGEHDYYYASGETLYQPTIAVPAFFHSPGRLERRLVPGVTSTIDLHPTIMELLDFDVPDGLDGVSLAGVVEGGGESSREEAFIESDYQLIHAENLRFHGDGPAAKWRAIVTGGLKLIHVPGDDEEWELYDLKNDPEEMTNLARGKPATVEALRLRLAGFETLVDRQETLRTSVDDEASRALRSRGYIN